MELTDITKWMSNPEGLNEETLYHLKNLVAKYPYVSTFRLLLLKNLYIQHDPSFLSVLGNSSAYIGDRSKLCQLIEGEGLLDFADEYKEADSQEGNDLLQRDATLKAIDTFLVSQPESPELLNEGLSYSSTDYFSSPTLQKDAYSIENPSQELPLFDSYDQQTEGLFSLHHQEKEAEQEGTAEGVHGEGETVPFFTETLAKIYIR